MNTETKRKEYPSLPLPQWALLCLIVFALFMARSVHSEPTDIFDAFTKWHYALEVTETKSFAHISKDARNAHHKMRWGVNLPAIGFIELFGPSMKVYSAVTITAFVIFYILLIRNALRYLPPAFVLLAAVLIYIDPVFMRYTTQLHTRMFGLLYILLAMLALSQKWRGQIFFAAFFLFAAYGAKATLGLFLGIPIAAFIFFKRGWKDLLFFSGYTAVFFIIETLAFNQIIPDISFGRIETLWGGAHNTKIIPGDNMEPFSIYVNITKPWKNLEPVYIFTAFFAFTYASIMLCIPKLRKTLDEFSLLWFSTGLSFLVWTWFNFISISPYRPLQEPLLFYTVFVFPYMFYIAVHALFTLSTLLPQTLQKASQSIVHVISAMLLFHFIIFGAPMGIKWKHWESGYYRYGAMWTMDEKLEELAGFMHSGVVGAIQFEEKDRGLANNTFFALKKLLERTETFKAKDSWLRRRINENTLFFFEGKKPPRGTLQCLYIPNNRNLRLEYTFKDCSIK